MKKTKLIAVLLFLFVSLLSAQVDKKLNSENIDEDIGKKPQKIETRVNVQSAQSSSSIVSYDFTTGSNKYYGGTAAAVEVEPGVWAMIAGDADGNGAINATDYLAVLPTINTLGYLGTDVDLNGVVNATDYLVIRPNINKLTYVP